MNKVKPTAKKVAANKQNAQKSTGPINTTSTRFNARKHGLVLLEIVFLLGRLGSGMPVGRAEITKYLDRYRLRKRAA